MVDERKTLMTHRQALPFNYLRRTIAGILDLAHERISASTPLHVPVNRFGQPAGWLTACRRADGRGDVRWILRSGDVQWALPRFEGAG